MCLRGKGTIQWVVKKKKNSFFWRVLWNILSGRNTQRDDVESTPHSEIMNIINLVQSPGYKSLLVQRKQQWKMASPVWSVYLGAPYWGETSVADFDKQRWREQCCRTLRSLRRVQSMNTDHRAGLYILYDGAHLHDNICWMLNVLSLSLPSDWREWSCFFPFILMVRWPHFCRNLSWCLWLRWSLFVCGRHWTNHFEIPTKCVDSIAKSTNSNYWNLVMARCDYSFSHMMCAELKIKVLVDFMKTMQIRNVCYSPAEIFSLCNTIMSHQNWRVVRGLKQFSRRLLIIWFY